MRKTGRRHHVGRLSLFALLFRSRRFTPPDFRSRGLALLLELLVSVSLFSSFSLSLFALLSRFRANPNKATIIFGVDAGIIFP